MLPSEMASAILSIPSVGGGGPLSIRVTAPTGSTVVAEKDGHTYTAKEESGVWDIGVPGYGTYTVRATRGDDAVEETIDASPVTANLSYAPQVFGVMWNYGNSSTALTRLTPDNDPRKLVNVNIDAEPVAGVGNTQGSSPFDGYLPWRGMEEYNIVNNAVIFKRGEDGFSRTETDTMVYIPEFYFSVTDDSSGKKRYWYISDREKEGFTKHPGSGRYVGRYNTGASYVSKSNLPPLVNIKRSDARTGSHNKGAKWWQYDYATWCAVWMLYIVEYADWDSQTKIGRGWVDGNSAATNSGGTDAMTYHTGRAAGEDGKTAVQYRHIENPWGNVFEWIDGINFNGRAAYISLDNASFKDDTTSGYTSAGVTLPSTNNYISGLGNSTSFPWSFLPNAVAGSATTYIPDRVASDTSFRVLDVGSSRAAASDAGLFYLYASNASSDANANIGARLIYIP